VGTSSSTLLKRILVNSCDCCNVGLKLPATPATPATPQKSAASAKRQGREGVGREEEGGQGEGGGLKELKEVPAPQQSDSASAPQKTATLTKGAQRKYPLLSAERQQLLRREPP